MPWAAGLLPGVEANESYENLLRVVIGLAAVGIVPLAFFVAFPAWTDSSCIPLLLHSTGEEAIPIPPIAGKPLMYRRSEGWDILIKTGAGSSPQRALPVSTQAGPQV
jgi:hypothetical protein